jgi:gas vesicle protein
MNKSEKTMMAFVLGAAAGLVTGFLFAPAKGKSTRQKLSNKATELKENIDSDKIRDLANSAISGVEKYSQKFAEVIKN